MEPFSILVFNIGSSSLKFELFETSVNNDLQPVIKGIVNSIGELPMMDWNDGKTHTRIFVEANDHAEAAEWILDWLHNLWPFGSLLKNLGTVAHRIVHGGNHFFSTQLITDKVITKLESLSPLAPLHNPHALAVLRKVRKELPNLPMFAVFDTAFFHDLPSYAGYALPEPLVKQYGIKRFGFHGIAHRYMIERYGKITEKYVPDSRVISFQLGHGCSATASRNGKAVDTSMGYTPLEGLMMATRAGDIDPGILINLLYSGVKLDDLNNTLNHYSGLSAIAKTTPDMRELLNRRNTDADSRLAIDMFCHRARKYLGAYMAILNGADAVLFGGGIGEHAPEIRERICADMSWCGLHLDDQLNQSASGIEMLISAKSSRVNVYVLPVNEEIIIAEDAKRAFIALNSPSDKFAH